MQDCLFCKIVSGDIPSNKVYEDDAVYAFTDVDPKAPVHVLIVPKAHMQDMTDDAAPAVSAAMFRAAAHIAQQMGLKARGFRCVINTGQDGGQTVPHLHMHLLGGRALGWPPG